MATVLVIGTFDTKGPESQYLRERIEAHGCKTLALDSGILGEADGIKPEFTRQMVAEAAGYSIDQLRNAGSRGKAESRTKAEARGPPLGLSPGRMLSIATFSGKVCGQ